MTFLLMFLGFALYMVMGMIKTQRKYGPDFKAMIYLKDEALSLVAGIICVVILALTIEDVQKILPESIRDYHQLIAVVVGYLNYTLLSQVFNIVLPKKFTQK